MVRTLPGMIQTLIKCPHLNGVKLFSLFLGLSCLELIYVKTGLFQLRVKGPHNVGDFSGRSGRSPGPLLTYLGLYIYSNAPKEGFPGIRQVFFD